MTNQRRLTDRQEQFVREYMVDLNATRAAVRAGYSRRGAGTRGWVLRQNPAVAARLRAAMDERARVNGITADRVLFEISLLGFANIMDYVETREDGSAHVDLSRLTREQGAAITAVELGEGGAVQGPARGGAVQGPARGGAVQGPARGGAVQGPARGGAVQGPGRSAAGKVKIKLADKSRSLELMGRHLGIFPRAPARENANANAGADADAGGEMKMGPGKEWLNRPLSDEELYQRILTIFVRGKKREAESEAAAAGGTG